MQTSMLLTMAHVLVEDMVEYENRPTRLTSDAGLHGLSARYRLYESADGWVFLAAPAPGEWQDLVTALLPYVDLTADARFADETGRAANDQALGELLAGVFRKQSADDWETELVRADVGCLAVRPGPPDRQLFPEGTLGRQRGWVTDVDHPVLGTHPRLMPLVEFSRSGTVVLGSELCGARTDAVLAEIGYDAERIAALREAGVII